MRFVRPDQLIRPIDQFLNGITMYRLMLYGLAILAAIAVAFGLMGALPISALALLLTLTVLLATSYVAGRLFAVITGAAPNYESTLITALILFFIAAPATGLRSLAFVAATALIAIASKYLLAFRRKHLFNPAALAAVVLGITGLYPASWWVATPVMLPFALLLGLLVVRKIRRFRLFLSFLLAALAIMLPLGLIQGGTIPGTLLIAFTSWPLIFFGTIMLTEPYTTPPRSRDQITYGLLVGGLFASQLHVGPIFTSPEVVLIVGNIYAYIMSPKYRLRLKLSKQTPLTDRISQFEFTPDRPVTFTPGQYMDFTLPHHHTDGRGNRRTFSIASSPTESNLLLGVKFYTPSSSFKSTLITLMPGATVVAGQIAGTFTLPSNPGAKLVFIAGGIGITPFRSMLKYLVDTGSHRDIALFYLVADPSEIVYTDVLNAAAKIGVRVTIVLNSPKPPATWQGPIGPLTAELLQQQVPDFSGRRFYISGPNAMVEHYNDLLRSLHVPPARIKTDYFPGY
jgi:ferredoxin-NADP reductase